MSIATKKVTKPFILSAKASRAYQKEGNGFMNVGHWNEIIYMFMERGVFRIELVSVAKKKKKKCLIAQE